MKKRLQLTEGSLIVKEGRKVQEFRLDQLRLVFLVSYFGFKWNILTNTTKQGVNVLDLDAVASEGTLLFAGLAEAIRSSRKGELEGSYLCLADFGTNSVQLSFRELKASEVDIFGPLAQAWNLRLERRAAWLAGKPQVKLFGGGGHWASVDERGFTVRDRFIAWNDVSLVKIETQDNGFVKTASLLAIPQGVSTGAFGMKQYHYSLKYIKADRIELYYAECTFWRTLASGENVGAPTSPLTGRLATLKELHDQGALSDERYAEAKAKVLAELG